MPSVNQSVWDIAVTENRGRITEGNDLDKMPREATLLLLGSKGTGKTTLIQKFLDREEAPRQTLALEYTYGRKGGKTLVKDVCHLWELGGGTLFTQLLETPMTLRTLPSLTIFLVLDLSQPQHLWHTMETLLQELKNQINNVLNSASAKEQNLREKLMDAAWKRIGEDHPDREMLTPFLVPLVIIGSKYDIFQDTEPDGKKVHCRALRFMAHTLGASLHFFSAKDAGLIKKIKELFSHHGFGTAPGKSIAQDYNKPLIIPAGADSLQLISGTVEDTGANMTAEAWKHTFTAKFPQESAERTVLPEDPSKDPSYAEPDIDNLRAQKDEELERIRREVGRSSAKWAEFEFS
ncbi:cytoplasmic dynein 2 light intermediate chain 1 [Oratosquilla oratoria]|uniref:cytoplasmic dynein 2 light intermediate chain 1 n=1 Tax=Oratosquilla oratoria TaxID=337810 RepID=UPI003F766FDB